MVILAATGEKDLAKKDLAEKDVAARIEPLILYRHHPRLTVVWARKYLIS